MYLTERLCDIMMRAGSLVSLVPCGHVFCRKCGRGSLCQNCGKVRNKIDSLVIFIFHEFLGNISIAPVEILIITFRLNETSMHATYLQVLFYNASVRSQDQPLQQERIKIERAPFQSKQLQGTS